MILLPSARLVLCVCVCETVGEMRCLASCARYMFPLDMLGVWVLPDGNHVISAFQGCLLVVWACQRTCRLRIMWPPAVSFAVEGVGLGVCCARLSQTCCIAAAEQLRAEATMTAKSRAASIKCRGLPGLRSEVVAKPVPQLTSAHLLPAE